MTWKKFDLFWSTITQNFSENSLILPKKIENYNSKFFIVLTVFPIFVIPFSIPIFKPKIYIH